MRTGWLGVMLLLAACGAQAPAAPVETVEAAPSAPAVAPPAAEPVTEAEPPEPRYFPETDVQRAWKAELEAQCAKDKPDTRVESFDVTGDGKPERICWRMVSGPPNGEYLDLLVMHEGQRRESGYFLLAVNGAVQEGVCPGDHYSITPEDWASADKREFMGIPDDWPRLGLLVSGGPCDPVSLLWPQDTSQYDATEVLFYFARL